MRLNPSLVKSIYIEKKLVSGKIVAILDFLTKERGLKLSESLSSAIKKYEIHELTTTDEKDIAPGKEVNSMGCVGFFEIKEGGVIVIGDEVSIGGKVIGKIVGFGNQHMPNHLNVVLYAFTKKTGTELDINIENEVLFEFKSDKGGKN
ncbi:hypothetical protein ES705_44018 [subsurface metagenome]